MRWIFLRGLVREQRHWGDFPKRFAETFGVSPDDILKLDFPGIGTEAHRNFPDSMEGLVDDLRQRVGLRPHEKIGIISMSLGSMCALAWANRWPSEVDRMLLVNTSASDLSAWHQRVSAKALLSFAKIFKIEDPRERERVILKLTSRLKTESKELSEGWAAYAPTKRQLLPLGLKQLWIAARFRAPSSVSMPTLILSSAADELVNPICSKLLAERLGLENHIHDKAGHDLILDDADWVIQQLREWMERHSA